MREIEGEMARLREELGERGETEEREREREGDREKEREVERE